MFEYRTSPEREIGGVLWNKFIANYIIICEQGTKRNEATIKAGAGAVCGHTLCVRWKQYNNMQWIKIWRREEFMMAGFNQGGGSYTRQQSPTPWLI